MSASPPPIPPPRLERTPWIALLLILGVAATLRYLGMFWGLPDKTHLFSYHPDEFHSLRGALSLLLAGDPNPHFFNYGSMYLYLVSAAAALADSSALGNLTAEGFTQLFYDWIVAARNLNIICGLATVLVAYFIANELVGRRLALVAAMTLAVLPLHVLHSNYATVDVPQTLFIALALLFAVKIGKQPRTADYLWAGLFAGLAASVKYNGLIVILAPLVAHCASASQRDEKSRGLALLWQPLVMLVLMAAAFAATSPYTFLDWPNARRDLLYEIGHMRAGEEPARSADPNGFLFHAFGLTLTTAGAALVALLGVVGLSVRRLWRPALGVILFGVVWFVMISLSNVRYGRYEVPLTPLLAVLVALAPAAVYLRRAELRLLAVLFPAAVIGFGLGISLLLSFSLRYAPDPRDVALRMTVATVPPDRSVGLAWEPWFNAPPLDRCNGGQVLRANPLWSQFKAPVRPLVVTGLDATALRREQPFAFILGSFETRDPQRVADPNLAALKDCLREDYVPAAVVERRAPLAGLWGWQPPQDWLYAFPAQTVYLHKTPGP